MADHLMDLPVLELVQLIQTHKVTPVDAVKAAYERIRERNGALNAFVVLCEERAMKEAQWQTEQLKNGRHMPILTGIPLGVKDLEDAEGLPTSYGCEYFVKNNIAKADSVQVARLRMAGAIVVGKTNVPIFGTQAHTNNIPFGPSRNPWNLDLTPGGSSGGSSAAVMGGLVPLVTAADGGGSIRIPAAFVGCFGLKPTYGRIPEAEGLQFGMHKWIHCTHFGPLTRTVEDAALFLDITAGYHASDPLSLPMPGFSYLERVRQADKLPSLKVAFSPDFGMIKVQSDIAKVVEGALPKFTQVGHKVSKIDVELPDLGLEWLLNMGAQLHEMIASYLENHETKFEPSFVKGMSLSKHRTTADIGALNRLVFELNECLAKIFKEYDILISPAMPVDPFVASGPPPNSFPSDGELFNQAWHIAGFMFPFNFSGHPAAVVRIGTSAAGLPVAIQIVGERHRDDLVLTVAKQIEQLYKAQKFPQPPFPFGSSTTKIASARL